MGVLRPLGNGPSPCPRREDLLTFTAQHLLRGVVRRAPWGVVGTREGGQWEGKGGRHGTNDPLTHQRFPQCPGDSLIPAPCFIDGETEAEREERPKSLPELGVLYPILLLLSKNPAPKSPPQPPPAPRFPLGNPSAQLTLGAKRDGETEAQAGEGVVGSEPTLGLSCPVSTHLLGSDGPRSQCGAGYQGHKDSGSPQCACGVQTPCKEARRRPQQPSAPALASRALSSFLWWPLLSPSPCPLPAAGRAVARAQDRAG